MLIFSVIGIDDKAHFLLSVSDDNAHFSVIGIGR